MEPNKLTITQIKSVLKSKNLSQTGQKAEMIQRMQEYDPTGEWVNDAFQVEEEASDFEELNESEAHSKEDEARATVRNVRIFDHQEMELLRRERELMEWEINRLRKENDMLRASPSSILSGDLSLSISNIKNVGELLSEYNGSGTDFMLWKYQLLLLKNTYKLDENATRILIGSKVKGKVFNWYHSKIEHFTLSTNDLLTAMALMFDQRPGRLERRRQFEAREWQKNETFDNYVHNKLILGNRVPVAENEIIDYIIEASRLIRYKIKLRMQCFTSVEGLIQRFKKSLESPKQDMSTSKLTEIKSYIGSTAVGTVEIKEILKIRRRQGK